MLNSIKFQSIAILQKGKNITKISSVPFEGSMPCWDIEALESGKPQRFADPKNSVIMSENDIVMVWDGSRIGLVFTGYAGIVGSTLMKIKLVPSFDANYIHLFLQSKYELLNKNPAGSSIPHVSTELLNSIEIPVGSLLKQKEIVLNYREQYLENQNIFEFSKNNIKQIISADMKGISLPANETIEETFIKMEQSVFQKAVSGELTSEWRKKNKIKDDWSSFKLENLAELITSGARDWSRYYDKKAGAWFIRVQNLRNGLVSADDMMFVKLPPNAEGKRTLVEKDDLLISIVGSIGKVALVQAGIPEAYINQAIALVRLTDKTIAKYIYIYFMSEQGQQQIEHKTNAGDAQSTLSVTQLRNITIPLPPTKEQKEMEKLVDAYLEVINSNNKTFLETKQNLENLQASIREKAFKELPVLDALEFFKLQQKLESEKKILAAEAKKKNQSNSKIRPKMNPKNNPKNNPKKEEELISILEKHSKPIKVEDLYSQSSCNTDTLNNKIPFYKALKKIENKIMLTKEPDITKNPLGTVYIQLKPSL